MIRASKKITFLIETLSDGGAERVTSVLANKFYEKGFETNIIIAKKTKNEYEIKNEINKYYITQEKSKIKAIRFLKKIIQVNNQIKKNESDIIISLATPLTNIFLIPVLFSRKKQVILSERNDPNRYPQSRILKQIRVVLYKLSNKVVFQTNDAKEYFSNSIQKKGHIIPNPIKDKLPNRYEGERNNEIVNFCRLDEQKNLKMLIDAFGMLTKEYPVYKLTIYGKGPLEDELKEYSKEKIGLEKVIFRGYEKNIHNVILNSAMFVSSSNYEGISNSMLEALALGLPTICTDCPIGGAKMFIKPYENGLLVPVGDTVALYEAMKKVIENYELNQKISKNAVKIRDELSAGRIFEQWLYLIE